MSLSVSPEPTPMIASSLLPGVTPALVEDALRAANREVDSQALLAAVRKTMEEHGAITPTAEDRRLQPTLLAIRFGGALSCRSSTRRTEQSPVDRLAARPLFREDEGSTDAAQGIDRGRQPVGTDTREDVGTWS